MYPQDADWVFDFILTERRLCMPIRISPYQARVLEQSTMILGSHWLRANSVLIMEKIRFNWYHCRCISLIQFRSHAAFLWTILRMVSTWNKFTRMVQKQTSCSVHTSLRFWYQGLAMFSKLLLDRSINLQIPKTAYMVHGSTIYCRVFCCPDKHQSLCRVSRYSSRSSTPVSVWPNDAMCSSYARFRLLSSIVQNLCKPRESQTRGCTGTIGTLPPHSLSILP